MGKKKGNKGKGPSGDANEKAPPERPASQQSTHQSQPGSSQAVQERQGRRRGPPPQAAGGPSHQQSDRGQLPQQATGGPLPQQATSGPPPQQAIYGQQSQQTVWDRPPQQAARGPPPQQATGGPPYQQAGRGQPPQQAGRGLAPQQAGRGQPLQQAGRGQPLQQAGRGQPHQQAGRGQPHQQAGRVQPHQQPGRGQPHQQAGRGQPHQQAGRGQPHQQAGRGQPHQQAGRGQPHQQAGRGQPHQQAGRGQPHQQAGRGQAPQQAAWGPSFQQAGRGQPPQQAAWSPPPQQPGRGQPPQQAFTQQVPQSTHVQPPPGFRPSSLPQQQLSPGLMQQEEEPMVQQTQKPEKRQQKRGRQSKSQQLEEPKSPPLQEPSKASDEKTTQQMEEQEPPTDPSDKPKKSADKKKAQPPKSSKPSPTKDIPPTEGDGVKDITKGMELVMTHSRRKGGTQGRKILIETNHFSLNLGKLETAYHYDVAIDPNKPKKLLRPAMEEFRRKYYNGRYPAFDGVKNLYSSSLLPFGNEIDGEVTVTEDDRPKTFKVTVKLAKQVDLTSLRNYLTNIQTDGRHLVTPQEAIQCVDIVVRSAPSLTCIPVGRSFFTQPQDGSIIRLGDGMEMYYGFYQSAILGWKPFLNVDVAHKPFPLRLNIIDLILDLFGRNYSRDSLKSAYLRREEIEVLEKFLRTLKVQYEIPRNPGSKRVYRVNGLKGTPDRQTFQPENMPAMTVEQYFRGSKNYNLQYPKLPCVWVGSKDRESPILLPAELCIVLEGQVLNRRMNENQTAAMIKHAATNTKVRKDKIMFSTNQANYNRNPSMKEFGFSVGDQFEKVNARILDPPSLQYQRDGVRPSRGVWRADRQNFKTPAELPAWTIVCADYRTRPEKLEDLASMVTKQGQGLGMQIGQPVKPFERLDQRGGRDAIIKFFKNKKHLKLIFVVIPDFGNFYALVKQAAELNVGCLTQCIKSKTIFRINPATVGNILLKVNAKLNGINHSLALRPACLSRPTMIMGADVTHPAPDSFGVPSVAAVTASHDPNAFKYNICWRLQPPRMEIIGDLENITRKQLMYFYKNTNQCRPQNIIFFRDGVSEGQFSQVLNAEVLAIRRACKSLQKEGYEPSITFLVVQKRHHTRFFPTNPRDSEDRNFNVPAGTCVDTVITHPTAQDFYLVSHASIQGVAKPTKYRTLWDDLNLSDDDIEQLTYFLCHMFARCNRSVSYPAPTYYAHLAAARAKVYCENERLDMDRLDIAQGRLQINEDILNFRPMFFV